MKKMLLAVVLVVASFGFTACDPDPKMFVGKWVLMNSHEEFNIVLELIEDNAYQMQVDSKRITKPPVMFYGKWEIKNGIFYVNDKEVKVLKLTSTEMHLVEKTHPEGVQKWKRLKK